MGSCNYFWLQQVIDDLKELMRKANFTILTSEIFMDDPEVQVRRLKVSTKGINRAPLTGEFNSLILGQTLYFVSFPLFFYYKNWNGCD